MSMTGRKKKPTWSDLKRQLADLGRRAMLGLIQDLYAASKNNQAFLHARFALGEDVLAPYKATEELRRLREENARLKDLLARHGIPWEEPITIESMSAVMPYHPSRTGTEKEVKQPSARIAANRKRVKYGNGKRGTHLLGAKQAMRLIPRSGSAGCRCRTEFRSAPRRSVVLPRIPRPWTWYIWRAHRRTPIRVIPGP